MEKLQQVVATPINGSIWYRNKGEKEGLVGAQKMDLCVSHTNIELC